MTNLAHVTINLDRMDGTDNVRGGYVVFDPRVDVPHAPTHIHVQTVTVVLDDTGRGETDLVAGIAYAVSSNRLRSGHTIAPLAAGQTVDLSQVITTGTPLTPSEGAALAARIAVLEDAPPGSYDDTEVRALITSGDAATLTAAKAYADGITLPAPAWGEVTGKPTTFAPSAHAHDAGDITSGVLAPARLGTGTPSASTVLYGDGAWKAAPTGGGGSGSGLSGTGSPEGVVTAPVGTEYLDTAGTCGAWRWLKVSGAGNTGWAVTYGDTGWRHLPIAGGGYFRVRRLNETIHWRLNGGSGVVAGTPLLTVPAGFIVDVGDPWFRPGAPIYRHGNLSGGHLYLTGAGGTSSAGGSTFYLTSGSVDFVAAAWMNYTTNDAWPTTLPGTAV